MQLKDNNALIYVGGGITKDSISENEWEETVNKTKTIGNVLA
jgi:isochorismate synthase